MSTDRPAASESTVPGAGLETGLAALGSLRWVAADLTLPLEEARLRLDLSPLAAVALGRALTGAALLRRFALKVPSRLLLEVRGDGPLGKVIAEADEHGHLRGTVGDPHLATPDDGELRIAPAVGRGFLRVSREGDRGRYSSQVELVSGELGDDITHYLEQSEQIRSAVLLGVLPRPNGIAAAGGLVVEALPGTEEEVVAHLEGNIRRLEGVSRELERGGIPSLAGRVLEGLDPEIVERQPLEYRCRCSRERLLAQLLPLAQREGAEALLGDDGVCEATCSFCASRYVFTPEELTAA